MEVVNSKDQKQVRYAGFWLRFVAYIIDDIILGFIGFVISLPFIGSIIFSALTIADAKGDTEQTFLGIAGILGAVFMLITATIVAGWLYYALMEASKQQGTLGKMALGLKVTDMEGNRISFGRATGRYFAKIISGMIFMIGYIIAGFTEKKQALHDMIANCLVIRK
ncbi:MAG: RDD family protein [Bacteroidales bacterium]|nr:MAG: RDD family protein [Bacteroidales bacterium]